MPGTDDAIVRAITLDEAPAWAAFLARERTRTYEHRMPASFREEQDEHAAAVAVEVREGIASGTATVLAAFVDERIVGVVSVVQAPEPWEVTYGHLPAPADRAIGSLYVHPDHRGTGLADRLLAASLDDRPVYLWIIDGNVRAARFYERRGWRAVPGPASQGWHGVAMRRMLRG